MKTTMIPMRDGVCLATNVYLPTSTGRFPAVLLRTPYGGTTAPNEKAEGYARDGYAFLVQDCRGRFNSDGLFYPWRGEAEDGVDTLQWMRRQAWCDGRMAMVGASYCGGVQWLAAAHRPRGLRCIVPRVISADFYDSPHYTGGAFQLGLNMVWGLGLGRHAGRPTAHYDWPRVVRSLPLLTADAVTGEQVAHWRDWVRHSRHDAYWDTLSVADNFGRITSPALIMGGWYDVYSSQAFTSFAGMRQHGGSPQARSGTRLIVGPWLHAMNTSAPTGDMDFSRTATMDLDSAERDYLERWLKGPAAAGAERPPIRLFVMGANAWRDEQEWPLARTRWTNFYLHSTRGAHSLNGDGLLSPEPPRNESADRFTYDPADPVPTLGGGILASTPHAGRAGPCDQRAVEQRRDVLVYTTPALTRRVEVIGPITVKLYASSSAPDTDFTVKLVDVFRNGYAMNLCDGIIRARYRASVRRAARLEPGVVTAYTIDGGVTGNVFKRGHRIRLEISSSNFPKFDRNPNTGHAFGRDAVLRRARQRVFHNSAYPSHVILPVIDC